MPHIFCIKHENVARCLFESATPFRLEIVQITSEGVSRLGSSVFAPVGRGTADHPDRDRQRDEHTADRRPDRQTRLHGQPRNQTQHMVPVQRERILPAVPAGASQDGAVDRPVPHRRPRAPEGRTPPRRDRRHARQRHRVRPPRGTARTARHGRLLHRPVPVVPARRQREPQRRDPPLPAQAHARRPVHGRRRYRPSWTGSTTVPCACSATAPRPRHSPTNCHH